MATGSGTAHAVIAFGLLCCAAAAPQYCTEKGASDVQENSSVVLVGMSAPLTGPHTFIGRAAADGLEAAFAEANLTMRLQFRLVARDDWYNYTLAAQNTRRLVCEDGAFAVAGSVGASSSEAVVAMLGALAAGLPDGAPVPFLGGLTSSAELRERGAAVAAGRASVANIRAGSGEELSSIIAFLARDRRALERTALLYQESSLPLYTQRYLADAMASLGTAVWSQYMVPLPVLVSMDRARYRAILPDAIAALLRSSSSPGAGDASSGGAGAPRAVVLSAMADISAVVVKEMVRRQVRGVQYVALAWVTAEELVAELGNETMAALAALNCSLHVSQVVPMPNHPTLPLSLEYQRAMGKHKAGVRLSHASLEGYMAGKVITMIASRTLELHGWPLTRKALLDVVFREVRSVDLLGYTLGPYGDGVGNAARTQAPEDWCNQGSHEVFMTSVALVPTAAGAPPGTLAEETAASFRFLGCTVQNWTLSRRAIVGASSPVAPGSGPVTAAGDDRMVQLGLGAAISAHNSAQSKSLMLTTITGTSAAANVDELLAQNAVALLGLSGDSAAGSAAQLRERRSKASLFAPLSGAMSLRKPFRRDVVNLLPSAWQEMKAAVVFLAQTLNVTRIGLCRREGLAFGDDCAAGIGAVIGHDAGLAGRVALVGSAAYPAPGTGLAGAYAQLKGAGAEAVVFVGDEGSAVQFVALVRGDGSRAPVVLTSATGADGFAARAAAQGAGAVMADGRTYRTSGVPPLGSLAAKDTLRQEYELWVTQGDRSEASFQGFVAGTFLSAVVASMDPGAEVTAASVVDAVYDRRIFQVGRLSLGPFVQGGGPDKPCNQGLDRVWLTRWANGSFVLDGPSVPQSRCGSEYDPLDAPAGTDVVLIVKFAVPFGIIAVCAAVGIMVVLYKTRTRLEYLNIRRSEVEINNQLGRGRFGAVHVGDWNGTTVAVRVIEKTKATRDDLRSIKREITLLYKLHHPNLLMLMGFCETKTELLVISEYMGGGSLDQYLRQQKETLNVFALIGIAFDVVKGIAYLHSAKPPVIHGNINTHNLLLDDKLGTKVSDFWFMSKRKLFSSSSGGSGSRHHNTFMAPEVVAGNPPTTATDVYAFGIVLWELFLPADRYAMLAASRSAGHSNPGASGSAASSGAAEQGVAGSVASAPEIPPTTPKEVVQLLNRCWAPKPEERPSIFKILHSWPSTFAAIGAFEVPNDLSASTSAVSECHVLSQIPAQYSANGYDSMVTVVPTGTPNGMMFQEADLQNFTGMDRSPTDSVVPVYIQTEDKSPRPQQ
eukprot:m51a1_g4797 putative serine threonine-protein kinase ctr1-like (1284) ;mRNA; r:93576-98147